MLPNPERRYRVPQEEKRLLNADVHDPSEVGVVQAAVREVLQLKQAPQQVSRLERWADETRAMVGQAAGPQTINDSLRLGDKEFSGSVSAVKRVVKRPEAERGREKKGAACGPDGPRGKSPR
jgi:hypothetical protein